MSLRKKKTSLFQFHWRRRKKRRKYLFTLNHFSRTFGICSISNYWILEHLLKRCASNTQQAFFLIVKSSFCLKIRPRIKRFLRTHVWGKKSIKKWPFPVFSKFSLHVKLKRNTFKGSLPSMEHFGQNFKPFFRFFLSHRNTDFKSMVCLKQKKRLFSFKNLICT